MVLPAELGGLEAPTSVAMDAIERLAAVDGSTAWCAIIGGGSNIFAGYLPPAGAAEVFADPDRSSATMFTPLGTITTQPDGTLRLTGRWPFVSNCLHAEWIGLVAKLQRGDGETDPVPRLVFVARRDIVIEDTWRTVGMQGTGSHHVTVSDLAIAPEQCLRVRRATLGRRPAVADAGVQHLPAAAGGRPARHRPWRPRRGRPPGSRQSRRPAAAISRNNPLAMHDLAAAELRLRAPGPSSTTWWRTAHDRAARSEPLSPQLLARIYLAPHAAVTRRRGHRGGPPARRRRRRLRRQPACCARSTTSTPCSSTCWSPHPPHRARPALVGLDVRYPPFVV